MRGIDVMKGQRNGMLYPKQAISLEKPKKDGIR